MPKRWATATSAEVAVRRKRAQERAAEIEKKMNEGGGVLLADLPDRACRRQTGEDEKGRALFCGKEGYPYCTDHKKGLNQPSLFDPRRNVTTHRSH